MVVFITKHELEVARERATFRLKRAEMRREQGEEIFRKNVARLRRELTTTKRTSKRSLKTADAGRTGLILARCAAILKMDALDAETAERS